MENKIDVKRKCRGGSEVKNRTEQKEKRGNANGTAGRARGPGEQAWARLDAACGREDDVAGLDERLQPADVVEVIDVEENVRAWHEPTQRRLERAGEVLPVGPHVAEEDVKPVFLLWRAQLHGRVALLRTAL